MLYIASESGSLCPMTSCFFILLRTCSECTCLTTNARPQWCSWEGCSINFHFILLFWDRISFILEYEGVFERNWTFLSSTVLSMSVQGTQCSQSQPLLEALGFLSHKFKDEIQIGHRRWLLKKGFYYRSLRERKLLYSRRGHRELGTTEHHCYGVNKLADGGREQGRGGLVRPVFIPGSSNILGIVSRKEILF